MLSYFFGTNKEEEKKENPDCIEAMKEAVDGHGDFETEMDGTLKLDDMFFCQGVILR
jgi:hypothetical protein